MTITSASVVTVTYLSVLTVTSLSVATVTYLSVLTVTSLSVVTVVTVVTVGYFEEKILEERIAADKPVIMKRAVYNKRRNLRAQSMRIIRDSGNLTVTSPKAAT